MLRAQSNLGRRFLKCLRKYYRTVEIAVLTLDQYQEYNKHLKRQ
jgi:hypothetical protein